MLLLSLSLALLGQPQDLSKKVSFTSVARPAKAMLAELSKSAGVALTTSQYMEDEVLILHVKDVSVAELMKRIATVAAGEWQQEGESFRLIRTASKTQELQREAVAKRTAMFTKSIGEHLAKVKDEPFDEARARQVARDLMRLNEGNTDPYNYNREVWERVQAIEGRAPAGRLYNKLLAGVDPAALAMIRPGHRVVFSTAPTRMQRPFSRDVSTAMRSYVKDQETWSDIAKKALDEVGDNYPRFGQALHNSRAVEGPPKALLIVSCHDGGGMLHTELLIADGTGRRVGHHSSSFGQNVFREPKPEEMQPSGDAALQLSPFSEKLGKFMQEQMNRQQGMPNMPPAIRKFLADVDKNDPLSTITSDALLGWAKAKKVNLVADVPDSCLYTNGFMLLVTKVTATSVQRSLDKAPDVVVTEADGWAEVRPADHIEARESRIDRPALAKLLRTAIVNGRWTLDDHAAYATTEKGYKDFNPVAWFFMAMVSPESMSLEAFDLPTLRLYGSLSSTQRKSLRDGTKIPLRMLSQQQQQYVAAMIYGISAHLMVRPPEQANQDFYDRMYGMGNEPTEAMPNGVPPTATLAGIWEDQLVAYAYAGPDEPTGRAFTPDQLGWELYAKENPEGNPWVRHQPTYTLYRPSKRLEIRFDFTLTKELFLMKQLHETYPAQNEKPVPFEKLPAEFREEAQRVLEEHRKGSRGNIAMPGTRKPPPR